MSFINGSSLAGLGSLPSFELEQPQRDGAQTTFLRRPLRGDGFGANPISLPIEFPAQPYGAGATPSAPAGNFDPTTFLNSIMQSLQNLMSQLASYFGASGSQSSADPGYAPQQVAGPQNFFTSATGSSLGDPHETFDGTTAKGARVTDRWDSMKSHADLLDSDSFRGGYRVATQASAPDPHGVTYNASASITTHGGNTSVTLDKDGSYAVRDRGRNVTLVQGQATQLGADEMVTLNADNSLTVVDSNRQSGTLTTKLSNNGNGIDVTSTGSNVDLGGYLVDKADRDTDASGAREHDVP